MSDDNPYPEEPELFDEEGDSMAFGRGIGDGLRRLKPLPSRYKSAEANPYYYYPGFLLGYLAKVGLVALGAKYGADVGFLPA